MASEKVSAAFRNAFAKLGGIDEAKQAEASMNNIPVPVGWKGRCQVIDMFMDVSKPKAGGGGQNPYINWVMTPVEDEKYNGKKISKNYTLNESVNQTTKAVSTPAMKFERFLNELEWAGMPRELRVGWEDIDQIIEWWLDPDEQRLVDVEVAQNGQYTNVYVRKVGSGAVDDTDSVTPPEPASKSVATGGTPTAATTVKFNGKDWDLISENGDDLVIKSKATGRERNIKRSELDD